MILGVFLCLLWALSFNLFEKFLNKGYYKYYPLWIGISTLLYWIGYVSMIEKHLFNERKEIRQKKEKLFNNKNLSYTYSKIDALIINKKLYLKPTLSLKDLAAKLNISEGYISQLINSNSSLNFNDYINSLRVNDAKEMLVDNEYINYTILAIGLESGFNSKSSFYTAFKKFTGKTPVDYKKDVQNL